MAQTGIISSLAMIKVNWDLNRRDYLETFVPILAECLRSLPDDVVSVPDLQSAVRTGFSLNLPQNVVTTLLKRLAKRGFVTRSHGAYHRNEEKLKNLSFNEVRDSVITRHEALVSRLVDFAIQRFSISWTHEKAEGALVQYLEKNDLLVLNALSTGGSMPTGSRLQAGEGYVVAALVEDLHQTEAPEFSYLETIVQGDMLAKAVFLPAPGSIGRRFKRTEIYFDTSFLMYALGHAGEPRRYPCTELLDLLYESGADLRCFRHTVDEACGILDACASRMAQGRLRDAYGPSIEYFLDSGFTASDVELFRARIEDDIRGLRVQIRDKPIYEQAYVIDEKKLQEELDREIGYQNPQALYKDVDSVAAVMRLRRGREFFSYENCRAAFVTTNSAMVRVSRDHFYGNSSLGAVSPCMTDHALTTLLWLKKPLSAPDLPRRRLIADYFAALRPDERFWKSYLAEIDKLERDGQLSHDDYFALRHSLEAKQALMDLTRGEEGAFTQGTVSEILEVVRSKIQEEAKSDLANERDLRARAEKLTAAAEARAQSIINTIELRASRTAAFAVGTVKYVVLLLLIVGVVSTFPWDLPSLRTSYASYIVPVLQVLVLFLTVSNLTFGSTVEGFLRQAELKIARVLSRLFKRFISIE
ncbi:MAG: hypothetical protein ACE10E_06535 [Acidiferrobacterales bacterium]